MESRTLYFDNPGAENTEATLAAVNERAAELGIKSVVLYSITGVTAARTVDVLSGLRLLVVTRPTGYAAPNQQDFSPDNRAYVESKGGTVYTVTPVFGGLSNAMNKRFKTMALGEVVANTLTIFGDGMRHALESLVTATDGGLVPAGEPVIAVAAADGGADTAVVCRPVNSLDFWDLRVSEIICKPRFL
jgi:uncharacterized protein